MSASPRDPEEARSWLAKAEQHLIAARILRDARGPGAFGCFACQQAAEIALKALLVGRGEAPPRSHDLVVLHGRLPEPARPAEVTVEELARWTVYAVAPRYPGFPDAEADAALPSMVAGVERLLAEVRAALERGV